MLRILRHSGAVRRQDCHRKSNKPNLPLDIGASDGDRLHNLSPTDTTRQFAGLISWQQKLAKVHAQVNLLRWYNFCMYLDTTSTMSVD